MADAGTIAPIDPLAGLSTGVDIGIKLFGQDNTSKTTTNVNQVTDAETINSGKRTSRLKISDEAVNKIVSDILSGPDGLASIFAGEQQSGIFNSSVANLQASDLVTQITGEIARLRAVQVDTEDSTSTTHQETDASTVARTEDKQGGLLDKLNPF